MLFKSVQSKFWNFAIRIVYKTISLYNLRSFTGSSTTLHYNALTPLNGIYSIWHKNLSQLYLTINLNVQLKQKKKLWLTWFRVKHVILLWKETGFGKPVFSTISTTTTLLQLVRPGAALWKLLFCDFTKQIKFLRLWSVLSIMLLLIHGIFKNY